MVHKPPTLAPTQQASGSQQVASATTSPLPGHQEERKVYDKGQHWRDVLATLRWSALGVNRNYNHGTLVETDVGVKMIDASSRPDAVTPGLLNPQKSSQVSGYITGAPVFGYMAKMAEAERVD